MCRIPRSRFYRDRAVFAAIENEVLPALAQAALAQGRHELRCWSAGCASGEEPYTIALLWHLRVGPRFPSLAMRIVATDVDARALERARTAWYSSTSVKEPPDALLCAGFESSGGEYCVRPAFRDVDFVQQDIRETNPGGDFDLILCRNAVLTYFAPDEQAGVMTSIAARLRPGAALVIGLHEALPACCSALAPWPDARAIFRAKTAAELEPPAHCIAAHPDRIAAHPELPAEALAPVSIE